MIIAKVYKTTTPQFFQVLKAGRVKFDPRDGWVLLAVPIGNPKDLQWVHQSDVFFDWIRNFNF